MTLQIRKCIFQIIGLGFCTFGLWLLIATMLNWAKLLLTVSICGLPLNAAALVNISVGYHLLRWREFGRIGVLVLTWLNTFFWFTLGVFSVYTGKFSLEISALNYESSHWVWIAVINVVSLLFSLWLTQLLTHPKTKALFQTPTATPPITADQ
jgi:hypothetical protein